MCSRDFNGSISFGMIRKSQDFESRLSTPSHPTLQSRYTQKKKKKKKIYTAQVKRKQVTEKIQLKFIQSNLKHLNHNKSTHTLCAYQVDNKLHQTLLFATQGKWNHELQILFKFSIA